MNVHIFGSTSSPSICGYALRKTVKDHEVQFSSNTVEAVLRDFYVHDLLKSFADAGKTVEVSMEIQRLLKLGGFELIKWKSNDRDVLAAFPQEERAARMKTLNLNSDVLPVDRALGICWNIEEDIFNLVVDAGKECVVVYCYNI